MFKKRKYGMGFTPDSLSGWLIVAIVIALVAIWQMGWI